MRPSNTFRELFAASLVFSWLLLMPPFSVTPDGKTFVDTGAPTSKWETFSSHPNDTDCRKHRDQLRAELDKAVASNQPEVKIGSGKKGPKKETDEGQTAFSTLRKRAEAARCVSSGDVRLRAPAASPSAK
jgi:hypothetical protein